jgi:AraC-like DNA-binding protein
VRYLEVQPSADLARDIHCYWELEAGGETFAEPIFPDGRVEIVVHLGTRPNRVGDSRAQPEVMVVGQMTTALRLQPTAGVHAVGIRFTPAGARAWLGAPLHECTDAIHDLDQIDSRVATLIRDAVHRSGALQPSIGALESALRQTRTARWASPRGVDYAVKVALARRGQVRVETLAASAGLGVRQLERQFLEAVGLSPKRFIKTARFQRALQLLARPTAASRCRRGLRIFGPGTPGTRVSQRSRGSSSRRQSGRRRVPTHASVNQVLTTLPPSPAAGLTLVKRRRTTENTVVGGAARFLP